MSEQQHITIIGAGIVGVCCARFLQRHGFAVTLVDKAAPGEGTSFGNLGMLCSTEHSVPLASVDVLKRVPQMLTDPHAPLSIRWRYLPTLLPWLIRFVRNSPEQTRMKNAATMATLMAETLPAYSRVLEGSEGANLMRRLGSVDVYKHEPAFTADAHERELIRSLGATVEELGADELRQLEPALSREFKHGVYFPDCGHCVNPFRLAQTIAADVIAAGGNFIRADVVDIETNDSGAQRLITDSEPLDVEALIVACGAWSGRLAATLGSPVPLEAERGYHTVLNGVESGLQRPVGHAEVSIGLTQMEAGLRIGGSVELAGLDAPPNYDRAKYFYQRGRELVPGLPPTESIQLTYWMGNRPSLPDHLPALGASPHHRNVWFAFGHQHLGLSLGARTGELIAQLVTGQKTDIDLHPFRIDRF